HRRHGDRKLPGNARHGPRSAVSPAARAVPGAGAALSGTLRAALFDGDVPRRDSIRGGDGARPHPEQDPRAAHAPREHGRRRRLPGRATHDRGAADADLAVAVLFAAKATVSWRVTATH